MRNETFHSLFELNYRIRECLAVHNATPMQRYGLSRKERFEQNKKTLLKLLPLSEFVVRQEVKAKVQRNYHVILGEDLHQYGVPYIRPEQVSGTNIQCLSGIACPKQKVWNTKA